MLIAGKIRGNAPQLGRYLLAIGENERITIMDVDGHPFADASYLKDTLFAMQLNSELTRTRNSVYHAYINPNPSDTTDRLMTMEEWQQSVDILTKQLGYEDQRRIVVLHEKPGNRIHAHIVYERYNHERGIMATYEDNYKAHDRAREQMEKEFGHKVTPKKNPHREDHKQKLSEIWHTTQTMADFIGKAEAAGYKVAKKQDRRPFRVIDKHGVLFDLAKMIDGAKTKDIRARLDGQILIDEKDAIREMQSVKQQHLSTVKRSEGSSEKTPAPEPSAQDNARQKFLQNVKDVRERNRSLTREITLSLIMALHVCFSFKGNITGKQTAMKRQFFSTAQTIVTRQDDKPPNKMLGFIEAAQYYKPT